METRPTPEIRSDTQPEFAQEIHPQTRLGYVHLRVFDLDNALRFYQEALGFKLHWRENDRAGLGAGGADLLRLTGDPEAAAARRTAGLYHFAVLMPSRHDLARSLYRLVETQTPLQGAADHWFSEAIYLADPEGNGIELYRDRPRSEWPPMEDIYRLGNGPFDLRQLLTEYHPEDGEPDGLHPDTVLGHMHLRVGDITRSQAFYTGILGFNPMMTFPGQAGFVSAGGYHHHVAYNIWGGRGVPPVPENAAGLQAFTIRLPDPAALAQVFDRVRQAGIPIEDTQDGRLVRDPDGIRLIFAVD